MLMTVHSTTVAHHGGTLSVVCSHRGGERRRHYTRSQDGVRTWVRILRLLPYCGHPAGSFMLPMIQLVFRELDDAVELVKGWWRHALAAGGVLT
jgi:hypothetical protein